MKNEISKKHLVSLNTAHIKLRNQHPRISEDLKVVFDFLKEVLENPEHVQSLYKEDGYLDIDE